LFTAKLFAKVFTNEGMRVQVPGIMLRPTAFCGLVARRFPAEQKRMML